MVYQNNKKFEALKLSIKQGKGICVIGPQLFQILKDDKHKSLYQEIGETLCGKSFEEGKDIKTTTDHYYAAQQFFTREVEESSPEFAAKQLYDSIRVVLERHSEEIIESKLLKTLANLNIPLYINLGYDDMLLRAIKAHAPGREPISVYPKCDEFNENSRIELSVDRPLIYNLSGLVTSLEDEDDDNFKKKCLTESGLYRLLVQLDQRTIFPQELWHVTSVESKYPIISLGIGWHKWYARMLMSLFSSKHDSTSKRVPSFSFEDNQIEVWRKKDEELNSLQFFMNHLNWEWDEENYHDLEKLLASLPKYSSNFSIEKSNTLKENHNRRVFVSFRSDALEEALKYTKLLKDNGFIVVADKRLAKLGGTQEIIDQWDDDAQASMNTCFCTVIILSKLFNDLSGADGDNPGQMELAWAVERQKKISTVKRIYICGTDEAKSLAGDNNYGYVPHLKKHNVKNLNNKQELADHIKTLISQVNKFGKPGGGNGQ